MTEAHTVHIESLAYGGDGIAHLADGRVAFVSFAAPGDHACIEVTDERSRFVRARISELIEPSADRVAAPCPYFGVCGGCQWQHVSYRAQLEAKRDAIVDALSRIGNVPDAGALVAQPVASTREYGYRNKIELRTEGGPGALRLGYTRHGGEDLLEVESCLLVPKKMQRAPRALAGSLRYIQGAGDLGISRVGLRVAANTKDIEVAVWTRPGGFPRHVAGDTLTTATSATSVVRVLVKEARGRKTSGVEVLKGKGFWRERLASFDFAVSAPSFFQVNTLVAEKLVESAVESLDLAEDHRVVDLYAGTGTFTLALAAHSSDVVAVESEGSSIRDLRRNLERAGLWAEVIGGDATRELPSLGQVDRLLVDPPRAGIDAGAISAIAEANPARIAYVSCDPPTLARDVLRLSEAGYRLVQATPFDMFPQSWHVETLAVLDRV